MLLPIFYRKRAIPIMYMSKTTSTWKTTLYVYRGVLKNKK